MNKGIVVSDLHLFSGRSEGYTHFEGLADKMAGLDTLVLNGDIFDFRWASSSHAESIPKAVDWLKELRDEFSHLSIHFIPGNHDCLPGFVERVENIDGVSLHSHYLRLGRNLFLHGDAATRRMDRAGFEKFRSSWENDSPRGPTAAQFYRIADQLRLTDMVHVTWFGGRKAIRRIGWHLDEVFPGWESEIDACFFGHTHLPLQGVVDRGVQFHNTGAGVRGASFVPIQFHYSPRHENH